MLATSMLIKDTYNSKFNVSIADFGFLGVRHIKDKSHG